VLQSLAVVNDFRRFHIRSLVARLSRELGQAGIEVLVLKGAALLCGGFRVRRRGRCPTSPAGGQRTPSRGVPLQLDGASTRTEGLHGIITTASSIHGDGRLEHAPAAGIDRLRWTWHWTRVVDVGTQSGPVRRRPLLHLPSAARRTSCGVARRDLRDARGVADRHSAGIASYPS
jgi:hypothetical protein